MTGLPDAKTEAEIRNALNQTHAARQREEMHLAGANHGIFIDKLTSAISDEPYSPYTRDGKKRESYRQRWAQLLADPTVYKFYQQETQSLFDRMSSQSSTFETDFNTLVVNGDPRVASLVELNIQRAQERAKAEAEGYIYKENNPVLDTPEGRAIVGLDDGQYALDKKLAAQEYSPKLTTHSYSDSGIGPNHNASDRFNTHATSVPAANPESTRMNRNDPALKKLIL